MAPCLSRCVCLSLNLLPATKLVSAFSPCLFSNLRKTVSRLAAFSNSFFFLPPQFFTVNTLPSPVYVIDNKEPFIVGSTCTIDVDTPISDYFNRTACIR